MAHSCAIAQLLRFLKLFIELALAALAAEPLPASHQLQHQCDIYFESSRGGSKGLQAHGNKRHLIASE